MDCADRALDISSITKYHGEIYLIVWSILPNHLWSQWLNRWSYFGTIQELVIDNIINVDSYSFYFFRFFVHVILFVCTVVSCLFFWGLSRHQNISEIRWLGLQLRPHDHKLRKFLSLKLDFEYLKVYWTNCFNNLQMWTKCTFKEIF